MNAQRFLNIVSVSVFILMTRSSTAADLMPLQVEDLYRFDGPQMVTIAPGGQLAAVIRRWIDATSRMERFALQWVDQDPHQARALEQGEPDARTAVFSPDGKWLAVRSTRSRPHGWKPTPSAPPESDPATDIWLVSSDGRRSIPLAGPEKPYGRVFADPFYGRVCFSPDGTRLAFIADDGRDPRTAEEIAANVSIVRPDQGEGYTGFSTAQLWVADLANEPGEFAARRIRRLTDDAQWYGDPQWTPDGRWLIVHANKTRDVESVRYSINKDYNLWAVDSETGRQRQLTFGPGPEVSPRISPDGSRLICLSSPRKGPHADVFNFVAVTLPASGDATPTARVLFDHHAAEASTPPHPIPAFPLPDDCWDGSDAIIYTTYAGVATKLERLDLTTITGRELVFSPESPLDSLGPAARRVAAQRRLTPPGNHILSERLRSEERVVHWTNESLELEGVLTLPPPQVSRAPFPLIVFPHGGPHSRSTLGFNFTAHVFAAQGYAVFQPNFRGSAGYGRKFLDADSRDLGGGDMSDILTGVKTLVAQGLADRQRQFIYGVSYGGYTTCWLVGHTDQFRAAVAQNAVTDMNVMWGTSDLKSWTQWELGGLPWEIPDAMRTHSPLTYIDDIHTPTLVLHSRGDRRCPIVMGRMFHQGLSARGVPTQMVEYPDEGHGIRQPRHQADVLRRTLDWFAAHDEHDSATTEVANAADGSDRAAAETYTVETVAGTGQPGNNGAAGLATQTNIDQPFGVEIGPDGALYITEVGQHRVRRLDLKSGQLTTVAGCGRKGYAGDGGPATEALLNEPYEVRFDPQGNMVFVEMQNHVVRRVDRQTGTIRTIAGTGRPGYGGDGGPATKAEFRQPHSIAFDRAGALYIADIGNHRIRRIDPETGVIQSIAGNGEKKLPVSGSRAEGQAIFGPRALLVDGPRLWIALREGNSVWRLNLDSGLITHVAGSGKKGFSGDGGKPVDATFDGPKGIAIDRQGCIVVMDTENQAVRQIDLGRSIIRTIAGRGPKARGFGGDGRPADVASFDRPHGICTASDGSVYVGDTNNHRVRRLVPATDKAGPP